MHKLFMFTASILSLTGCASLYDAPSESEPHATVSFVKGYLGKQSAIATYAQETSNSCNIDDQASIAKLGPLHKKPMVKRIGVEAPMSILATFIKYENTGNIINGMPGMKVGTTCFSRVTFTPQDGQSYRAHLIEKSRYNCQMLFTDEFSGEPPEDAIIQDGVVCSDGKLSK